MQKQALYRRETTDFKNILFLQHSTFVHHREYLFRKHVNVSDFCTLCSRFESSNSGQAYQCLPELSSDFICELWTGKNRLHERLQKLCSSKNRDNLKNLNRNYSNYTGQSETDSKIAPSDYCGMKNGKKKLWIHWTKQNPTKTNLDFSNLTESSKQR